MDKKGEKIWKASFFVYLLLVIRLILLKYPYEELKAMLAVWNFDTIKKGLKDANFVFFRTIRMYIQYYERLNSFENLFGNILIFVPYGMLYVLAFRKGYSMWIFPVVTLLFIIAIEGLELLSGLGKFDVDDILLNMLGSVIGFIIMIAYKRRKWYDKSIYK